MLVRLKYWFNNTVFLLCSIFMLCLPIVIPLAAVIFVGFIFAEVKGDTIALLLLLSLVIGIVIASMLLSLYISIRDYIEEVHK